MTIGAPRITKSTALHIRMEPEEMKEVQAISGQTERGLSEVVRRLLKLGILYYKMSGDWSGELPPLGNSTRTKKRGGSRGRGSARFTAQDMADCRAALRLLERVQKAITQHGEERRVEVPPTRQERVAS